MFFQIASLESCKQGLSIIRLWRIELARLLVFFETGDFKLLSTRYSSFGTLSRPLSLGKTSKERYWGFFRILILLDEDIWIEVYCLDFKEVMILHPQIK